MPTRSKQWTPSGIDAMKARIKREIDASEGSADRVARLAHVQAKIRLLADKTGAESTLKLWVYVMTALVHHERHGGLAERQVNQLTEIAYGVLKIQGVAPETSDLCFLYGELHLVFSQIHRRAGRHLRSFWEQQLSLKLSRRQPTGGRGFQALSIGIRSQRLGHMHDAMEELRPQQELAGDERWELARINRIRCLRLAGDASAASRLLDESDERKGLSSTMRDELAWERLTLQLQKTRNPASIVKAIKAEGSHHAAVYIAEAYLWLYALDASHWLERLPKVATLARKSELRTKSSRMLFKTIGCFEDLRDEEIPLARRLRELGATIAKASGTLSIDRELLILVAGSRWLVKTRNFTLARATLREYRSLSIKLTEGASDDVLGLAGDLYDRPWFGRDAAA